MTRIYVTAETEDEFESAETVGYFTQERAERWGADTEFDGSNLIDVNTRSQWHHQELYRTAQGRWVLGSYSNYQGSTPSYVYVDDEAAHQWLIRNGHDEAAAKHFGSVPDERGPGRPEVGSAVHIRLGDLLGQVDAWAEGQGVSRADAIRKLITAGLEYA